ncbi:curved DNA-binding protein CbpA [Rhizobium beringeri]
MSQDPYELLGVKRDATQKDIQSAFRKLAKKLHPDLNPGDKKAEERFKEISAANEILSDEEKTRPLRSRRDRHYGRRAGAA